MSTYLTGLEVKFYDDIGHNYISFDWTSNNYDLIQTTNFLLLFICRVIMENIY